MKQADITPAVLNGSMLVVGKFVAREVKPSKKGTLQVETYWIQTGVRILTLRQTHDLNASLPNPGFKPEARVVASVASLESNNSGFLEKGKRVEPLEL